MGDKSQDSHSSDTGIIKKALQSGLRIDDLQCGPKGGSYRLIQDPKNFCFGVDAVCLSDFAAKRIKKGETVLDLCTGTGVIPILLCAKTEASHITGLEIQPQMVEMARQSVKINGLQSRIRIDCGDVRNGVDIYPPNSFDAITVNPPYIAANSGILRESESMSIARHEIACNLTDIAVLSARLLKTGGRLYMVHRPNRLAEIFCVLRRVNLEPKAMQFAQSSTNHEPSLVMIEAADHGRSGLTVEKVMFLGGR